MKLYDLLKNCGFSEVYNCMDQATLLASAKYKNGNTSVEIHMSGYDLFVYYISITCEKDYNSMDVEKLKDVENNSSLRFESELCDESIKYVEKTLLFYKLRE